MQIEKDIKKQIAMLQKELQEGHFTERDFFILNPERSYQFDWAEHKRMNVLAKYCIFTSEDMLMVMRPYQITATEQVSLLLQMLISTKWKLSA